MSNAGLVVLGIGLAIATVVDLRSRRIPNELTAAMTGVGIGLAASAGTHMTLPASLAGLVLGFLVMMPGYALGATGAGDVKLMGAVGALVGPGLVISAFLFTSVAGGVLALLIAIQRNRLAETVAGTTRIISAPGEAPRQIQGAGAASRFAYGPAIAVGSLVAVLIA